MPSSLSASPAHSSGSSSGYARPEKLHPASLPKSLEVATDADFADCASDASWMSVSSTSFDEMPDSMPARLLTSPPSFCPPPVPTWQGRVMERSASSPWVSRGSERMIGVGGASPPVIELRLSLRGLFVREAAAPCAVLYASTVEGGVEKIGATEAVAGATDPHFATRFLFSPKRECQPTLLVKVYGRGPPARGNPQIGRAEVDLGKALGRPGGRVTVPLVLAGKRRDGSTVGAEVSVFVEPVAAGVCARGVAGVPGPGCLVPGMGKVVFRVDCAALRRKGLAAAAGRKGVVQFYEILRRRGEAGGGTSWTTVYRSEDGRRESAQGYVLFKPAFIDEGALHNGRPERELRFVFLKRNARPAPHEVVCHATTSAADLLMRPRGPGRARTAVPLNGADADYEGMGALQCVATRRDPRREDVVVVDLSVNIFMPRGYTSALNDNYVRRRGVVRGRRNDRSSCRSSSSV